MTERYVVADAGTTLLTLTQYTGPVPRVGESVTIGKSVYAVTDVAYGYTAGSTTMTVTVYVQQRA